MLLELHVSRHANPLLSSTVSAPAGLAPTGYAFVRAEHLRTGFASSSSQASVIDPSEKAALQHLESGNRALEDGDVASARDAYKKSVEVQRTATALHNLGVSAVTHSVASKADYAAGGRISPQCAFYGSPRRMHLTFLFREYRVSHRMLEGSSGTAAVGGLPHQYVCKDRVVFCPKLRGPLVAVRSCLCLHPLAASPTRSGDSSSEVSN